jgi:hypothetical protein
VAVVGSARAAFSHLAAFVLAPPVAWYIRAQRDRLLSGSRELQPRTAREFEPYFAAATLKDVRVAVAESLNLPRFPYARLSSRLGMDMPDPELVAAITFDNVIAIRRGASSSHLLFHELVHVVQYRLLGVSEFARLYVRGFIASGSYENIPLERCASGLEERFARRGAPFSVEDEVRSRMRDRLL